MRGMGLERKPWRSLYQSNFQGSGLPSPRKPHPQWKEDPNCFVNMTKILLAPSFGLSLVSMSCCGNISFWRISPRVVFL